MKRALVALAAALVLVVGPSVAHGAGETITIEDSTAYATLDPQAEQGYVATYQIHFITCEGLYDYPDSAGTAGLTLQPDVATGWPTVSADGLTYTFTIRDGFEFSDGTPVTAQSFAYAIQRLEGPVGLSGAYASATADFASYSASGNQLTITLARKPDLSLLARLAEPVFCPAPASAPATEVGPDTLPTDGPYYVSDASGGAWTLSQNPDYGGTRIRNLGAIVWRYGVPTSTAEADVLAGTADYAPDIPADPTLAADYGPGSAADSAGHQQYFLDPASQVFNVTFNTRPGRPLADPAVRQEVACAIDRAAFASQVGGFGATATDHFIAPGFPGSVSQTVCSGVGAPPSGLVLNGFFRPGPSGQAAAELLANELAADGVTLNSSYASTGSSFFSQMPNTPSDWDVTSFGWGADNGDPGDFLQPLFASDGSSNWSGFSDPQVDADLAAAEAMTPGPDQAAAFAGVDHEIALAAPAVAEYSQGRSDLFSPRIGCQVYQPIYGMNLNLLCVRVASSSVPPGGTLSTGTDATPSAPLQTSVTTQTGGSVTIQQGVTTATTVGYGLLSQQLQITAPPASGPSAPLVLSFTLDASLLGGADPSTVDVFRNGSVLPNCDLYPGSTVASPDPCVASRTLLSGGDLQILVLTTEASTWNFGILAPAQLAAAVRTAIGNAGLPVGIANSLIAKLQPGGCGPLKALANELAAQSGKQIPIATARELLADVAQLRAQTHC